MICITPTLSSLSVPVDLDAEQDDGVLEEGAEHKKYAGYYPRLKMGKVLERECGEEKSDRCDNSPSKCFAVHVMKTSGMLFRVNE